MDDLNPRELRIQDHDGLEVNTSDLEPFDLLIAPLFLRLAQAIGGHVLESRTVN